jgi:hypothetical protein
MSAGKHTATPARSKSFIRRLRERGAKDAQAGKPIDAFYKLPYDRHYEWMRAAYEVGWRDAIAAAKEQTR